MSSVDTQEITQPRTKWPVLIVSGVFTFAVAAWALFAPDHAGRVLGDTVSWISNWFGWFYILLATAILVFVVYLGLRYSKVRLGADSDRPEFSNSPGWSEATDAGSYVGQKVVVNEFVAFSNFAPNVADFSQRTQAIVTFALTSFPNLGSLGILLGGLGGMAPKRRGEIAELGLRATLAATLANLMSAAITGILLG